MATDACIAHVNGASRPHKRNRSGHISQKTLFLDDHRDEPARVISGKCCCGARALHKTRVVAQALTPHAPHACAAGAGDLPQGTEQASDESQIKRPRRTCAVYTPKQAVPAAAADDPACEEPPSDSARKRFMIKAAAAARVGYEMMRGGTVATGDPLRGICCRSHCHCTQ